MDIDEIANFARTATEEHALKAAEFRQILQLCEAITEVKDLMKKLEPKNPLYPEAQAWLNKYLKS